jgi:hypothetical protein
MSNAKRNPEREAAEFNRKFPVGTRCRYWRGARGTADDAHVGEISKPAFVLMDHMAVVLFRQGGGCVALSHVEPIAEVAAKPKPKRARKGG